MSAETPGDLPPSPDDSVPEATPRRMSLVDHALAVAACAAVAGAVEALIRTGDGRALAAAGAVAVLITAGLVVGLVQGVVVRAILRVDRWFGAGAWLAPRLSHTSADRNPVVRLHAVVVGVLATALLAALMSWVLLATLEPVTSDEARRALTIAVFGGLAAFVVVGGLVVARALMTPLASLDERIRLPFPHHNALRVALYVAVPTFAVLVPFVIRYGAALGLLTMPLILIMFVAGELALVGLWRAVFARYFRREVPFWAPAVLAVLAVGAVLGTVRSERVYAALTRTHLGGAGLALWHVVTDVDRDGFSLLGSADCAAFDSHINPLALDVPGNGVDEDCDGRDAEKTTEAAEALDWNNDAARQQSKLVQKRYNIVWVVVDATRADHVSLLGYKRSTTPYLSTMRKNAMTFHAAYSQSSATMLSVPSMLTGRNPGSLAWHKGRGGKLQTNKDIVSITKRLRDLGYRTGITADGYILKYLHGFSGEFENRMNVWLDGKRRPWHGKSGGIATSLAIRWLEKDPNLGTDKGKPFFLLAYSSNPHDPYGVHPEMSAAFGKSEIDRYDSEIAYADRHIGFLVDYIKNRRPLWNDTIFIFTSDHGEEFGEHGGKIHGYTCYNESVHVPLLVRIPGMAKRAVKQRVALVDIVPTLLEALGLDKGDMELDGQSLLVPAFGGKRPTDRQIFCSVLSQKRKQGNFFRRSVRIGNKALFHDAVPGTYELYDTATDPGEKRNIFDANAEAPDVVYMKDLLARSMSGNLAQNRMTK